MVGFLFGEEETCFLSNRAVDNPGHQGQVLARAGKDRKGRVLEKGPVCLEFFLPCPPHLLVPP